MFLRTTFNAFFKSRQKILIKRRKIQFKNRPLSNKRLKQEREQMNAAYETKKLNIRKQMDRTQSPNLHINEIVEELFYPELSFNNQEEVDQRVRQVSNDALEKEVEWQNLVRMDSIISELNQNSLPLELLQTHQKNAQMFSSQHYAVLLQRMNYYVFHIEAIKKKRMDNWALMMKSLKAKGNKSQQIKCPYLFLSREQVARHQLWHNMIQKMRSKIQKENHIKIVNHYIPSLLLMQQTFYYIPADLYQAVLNKNAAAPFKLLTSHNISDLLTLMKFRNKIKFNPNIKIENPLENNPKQQSHLSLGRKLASAVIENPKEYTAEDLSNIFKIINIRKNKMQLLQQRHFKLIEEIIMPLLNELSFESVQTFFVVYCSFNQKNNRQFSEMIKYDLYRKADQCQNYFYIYDLLTRIKSRSLNFRVYMSKGLDTRQFRLEAYDLLLRLSQVITKMTEKLRSQEVVQILATYYDNDIRDQAVIEILSTEIVKRGSELELQVLGKSFFQLTVLGHSSKILTKYVLQQFDKSYHHEMKKYKEEGVFLLPTEEKVTPLNMNFKQIYLQECLLMSLWSITKQMGDRLQKEIDLMKLLDLIPVKIESIDPLAMQLAININAHLKPLGMFPKITFPSFSSANFPFGRFEDLYFRDYSRDKVDLLMAEQARQSKLFIENYNPKAKLFLSQRWSGQNTYSKKAYIDFCLQADKNQSSAKALCFYDDSVELNTQFLQKRQEVIASLRQHLMGEDIKDPKKQTKQKSTKVYDLLL